MLGPFVETANEHGNCGVRYYDIFPHKWRKVVGVRLVVFISNEPSIHEYQSAMTHVNKDTYDFGLFGQSMGGEHLRPRTNQNKSRLRNTHIANRKFQYQIKCLNEAISEVAEGEEATVEVVGTIEVGEVVAVRTQEQSARRKIFST